MPQGNATIGRTGAATRALLLAGLLAAVAFLFRLPLLALFRVALDRDESTHALLVPLISAVLLFGRRKQILPRMRYDPLRGSALLAAGLALFALNGRLFDPESGNWLSLAILACVVSSLGAFVLAWGTAAFRSAMFPLLFLLLLVPLPPAAYHNTVSWLQQGSAASTEVFFRLFGVSAHREGLIFVLPGVSIDVAPECSGIRSTIALLITALFAAQMYLRTRWAQVLVCVLAVALSIVKNGLRIAILSSLGASGHPSFLFGPPHRYGGFFFFLVALGLLAGAMRGARFLEQKTGSLWHDHERAPRTSTPRS